MVFYRKYRPQTISELDLEAVRRHLLNVLRSDDIAHAFLFTGPKGLGKTSAARIVAKAINCEREKPSDIEPCNNCSACISITNGSNIDVIEIDGASNRGVDEIRDLREKVKFSPASLRKKVYIIDEVHMLTNEAFNALLKTLEEPPEHVIFILCTTEPWKLPETITSRTFLVRFEKPTREEIIHSLERIIKSEKLQNPEKEVLDRIFQLSEGSFRDASKILEELSLASPNKKITLEMFELLFKTQTIENEVKNLLLLLSKKDMKKSLEIIDKLSLAGVNFKLVIEKIVDHLRLLLLLKAGIKQDISDIKEFDTVEIQILLDYFQTAYQQLKYTPIAQLPLELAVVKWCLSNKAQKQEQEDKVSESKKNPVDNDSLKKLIEAVKKENHSIAGILRSCKIGEIRKDQVELVVPYKFHKEKLSDAKTKDMLDKNASEIFDREVKIFLKFVD